MEGTRTIVEESDRAEVVHDFAALVQDRSGTPYHARAWAEPAMRGSSWSGWLEFLPAEPGYMAIRTGIETTQFTPDGVAFWAKGLGARFLEDALERARWRCGIASESQPICVAEYELYVFRNDGKTYRPRAYARVDRLGSVVGWLEFEAIDGGGPVLRTGVETTQSNIDGVTYWAGGLEPVYFEGALERASARTLR